MPKPASTPVDSDPTAWPDVQAARHALIDAQGRRDWRQARSWGESALARWPQDVGLWHIHAVSLALNGEAEAAVALWQRVLARVPDHAEALANLGNAYLALKQPAQAITHLQRALQLQPDDPTALYNMAVAQHNARQWAQAEAPLRHLLDLQAQHSAAWSLLAQVKQAQWDYPGVHDVVEAARQAGAASPELLHRQIGSLMYCPQASAARLNEAIARWAASLSPVPRCAARAQRRGGPLRIGLVSGDLAHHPVGLLLLGLLRSDAARALHWVGLSNRAAADATTEALQAHCQAWHVIVHMNDAQVVDLVRREDIDVLIDLSGHTVGHRLGVFRRRPAPLQMSWLGFHASTGLSEMDAILADDFSLPEDEATGYAERQVLRLPHTRYVWAPEEDLPPVSPLPALQRGHITFGSFQDLTKISDATLRCWARIAEALPAARFRVQSRQWDPQNLAQQRFGARCARAGLPMDRLDWAGNMPWRDYLAAYAQVDVVLDSFPFPSGAKTLQALWMGVPTLTLSQAGMLGRQGAALMTQAGLASWVARDEADYVAKAVAAAQAPALRDLAAWRMRCREALATTPVFDHQAFGRDWVRTVQAWAQAQGLSAELAPALPADLSLALKQVLDHASAGQRDLALSEADALVAAWPQAALAHNMRAWVLDRFGRADEAAEGWREAVRLAPTLADAWSNLGLHEKNRGRLAQAKAHFEQALRVAPAHLNARFNLGQTHAAEGDLAQAQACFEAMLDIEPDHAQAINSLGVLALRRYDFDEAVRRFAWVLQRQPGQLMAWSNLMFALHYQADAHPQQAFDHAKAWGDLVCAQVPRCALEPAAEPNKRLRIGLLSGDLRDHSVTHFLRSLLESSAAAEVDWYAYANNAIFDEVAQGIAQRARAWHHIHHLNDERVCALIQQDGIDVLVDLAGVTAGHRVGVFMRKPAPVQVSWLGYFATLGLPTMDAVLADPVCVPEGEDRWFTEQVWRLPQTRLCMVPPMQAGPVVATPALEAGHITFGSFQDLAKLNDHVLALWGRIARAVPSARFRIQARFLDAEPDKRSRFEARLQAVGIDLSRVSLSTNTSFADYFTAHGEVDVLLDSFPYPGGTTSVQAVWMGVPTVTLARPGMLARQGEQVLRAVGLDDWVAEDDEAYVACAVAWAQAERWPALNRLRLGLRERARRSALFDGERFGRDWLNVVRQLWAHRCAVEGPVPEDKSAPQVVLEQALALQQQGQLAAAVHAAQAAVKRWPQEALAHNMLGAMLQAQGRMQEAVEAWQQAIALSPRLSHALYNLGRHWCAHGQAQLGLEMLARAVQAAPKHLAFQLALADALQADGQREAALPHYEAAVALNPQHVQAQMNLGMWHARGQDFEAAHRHYRQALALDPSFIPAQFNLGFTLHYAYPSRAAEIASLAKVWGQAMAAKTPLWPSPEAAEPNKRLRVGLVSADLRDHPVGYFLQPLLDSAAARDLDWVALSNQPVMTPLSGALRARCSAWHVIHGMNDEQVCALIAREQIDILIDLGGYTGGARLGVFARKPAPLQLTWLGYFASTGLPTMDGVIADPVCVPPQEAHWFTERVWRLPVTRLCLQPPAQAPQSTATPALSGAPFTFGSFQDLPKITDDVLRVWAQVLTALPEARLRVQAKGLSEEGERARLRQRLGDFGVTPERLMLVGWRSFEAYLQSHAEVDVILDSFSFPGGTTTAQSLWMGVPTITLTQPGMLARQGEQMLRAVGLDDWVADSPEAFVALARHWADAAQWPALNHLRLGLRARAQRSALFDGARFGRDMVALLRSAWQDACAHRAPPEPVPSPAPQASVVRPWRPLFRQAMALRDQGQSEAAAECLQAALSDHPEQAEVLNLWGILMEELGRQDEWDAVMPRLAQHGAADATSVINVARWHMLVSRYAEARDVLRAYHKRDKDHVGVMVMLAPLLRRLDDTPGALRLLNRALSRSPTHVEALFKRGVLHESVGQWARARADYDALLALAPSDKNALINRMMVAVRLPDYDPFAAAEDTRRLAQAWAQALGPWPQRRAPSGLNKRLRIGVVSADLGVHPVGYFFEALMLSGAAQAVDWVVYANAAWDDEVNARLRARAQTWHDVSALSTDAMCAQVVDDAIDVLLDLSGYTAGSRLDVFARRPAPVQVAWLGYFATTGLPGMDAVLADPVCVPEDEAHAFSETVWRLPHTRLCMPPLRQAPEVAEAPVMQRGHITLGCIQDPQKIGDEVLRAWARIAKAVPNVRIVLQHSKLGEESATRRAFTERLQAAGISNKQLSFGLGRSFERYLAGFDQFDVLLDTWPYTGGTTTVQALWMGVPTVSLATPGMIGRQGQGLLSAAGLQDWVTHDVDAYVARVLYWCDANHWAELQALRTGLRERLRQTPLFDTERFARDWLATLRGVWQHACLTQGTEPSPEDWQGITAQAQRWRQLGLWCECVRHLAPLMDLPTCPMGLMQLQAVALGEASQPEAAIALWRRVIHRPDADVNAWGLSAQHLERLGEPALALEAWRRLLVHSPEDLSALSRLAHAALAAEDWPLAIDLYTRWLRLQPDAVAAGHNLGVAHERQGDIDAAMATWAAVLVHHPQGLSTMLSLGLAHNKRGEWDAAMAMFMRILAIEPTHRDAHDAMVSTLFSQHLDAQRPPALTAQAAMRYGQQLCRAYPARVPRPRAAQPDKLLRIGFVSGDLNDHPVAYFLMPLLKWVARDEVHWLAYHTSALQTPHTQALRARVHTWRQVQDLEPEALAQRIRDDRVDVLIDLAGFTAGHRLEVFAQAPAPLQLTWLGYFGTVGLPTMDAVLADAVSVPKAEAAWFSERVQRLAHTRLCLAMPPDAPAVAPLPAPQAGHATVACFQQPDKINDEVLGLWARIAQQAPDLHWRFQHKAWEDPHRVATLHARMRQFGFPVERVQWHGKTLRPAYLAAHAEVDFILDTFPYNGGTTTAEALVMGVPTVVWPWPGMAARQGQALMTAAGLADWVAQDADDYLRLALHWASPAAWPALARLRASLRKQVLISPLMDGASFAADWTEAVRALWQDACQASIEQE